MPPQLFTGGERSAKGGRIGQNRHIRRNKINCKDCAKDAINAKENTNLTKVQFFEKFANKAKINLNSSLAGLTFCLTNAFETINIKEKLAGELHDRP